MFLVPHFSERESIKCFVEFLSGETGPDIFFMGRFIVMTSTSLRVLDYSVSDFILQGFY